jgi:undecaprenyl-diphosphatase
MQTLDFIQQNMRSEFLDAVMIVITSLGNGGILWIVIALIFIATKKYRSEGFALAAALLMHLLICNIMLKPLIARIRPCDINTAVELLIPRPHDYSFPSGHTSASFAGATVICYANKRIGILAVILAAAIAFSRLYLYVHYPSDVLGGAGLGIALGMLSHGLVAHVKRPAPTA